MIFIALLLQDLICWVKKVVVLGCLCMFHLFMEIVSEVLAIRM